jgi:23S rRNA (uracil1939-C5)-methyltransferase
MPESAVAWLNPDGSGGARVEGGAVRIPGVVPGDVAAWREVGRRGRTIHGEVEALTARSVDRVTPPCAWDDRCGGCDLSFLGAEARRRGLAEMVSRALDLAVEIEPSPRSEGHRARIKLAIEGGRVGYRAHRSRELVEATRCLVARDELNVALELVRAALADAPDLPSTDVELRTDGERVVAAFHGGRWSPEHRAATARLGDVALDGHLIHGDPTLRVPVAGLRLDAGPDVFFQVNLEGNEALVAWVVEAALEARAEAVLDLYAGIGNLSLPVAARGVPVVAVELAGRAIADLRTSAGRLGFTNVRALPMDVARFEPSREAFDVVILDPPRAGAADVLPRVLRNRPRRAILVSCDVNAAVRDVNIARKAGYTLTRARCFDLFPDTHHVETVSVLDRAGR